MLRVCAAGFDETLDQVRAYGMAIIEAALAHGAVRVLCDERSLEYRLGVIDTYRAAKTVAASAPSVVRVAIVCHPACVEDAGFFENVAVNRGLTLRTFTDLAAATAWLTDDGCAPLAPGERSDAPA